MNKKYVIVTNATRARINSHHSCCFGTKVDMEYYDYRKGELGLIHPKITKSKVHLYDKEDIPILIWRGYFPLGGSIPNQEGKRDYFLIALRKYEFTEIKGLTLAAVKKGIERYYKNAKSLNHDEKISSALESIIEEYWRHLEAFDTLINKNDISKLPVEFTQRKITQEEVEKERKFQKEIDALEGWREKSENSDDFIFGQMVE